MNNGLIMTRMAWNRSRVIEVGFYTWALQCYISCNTLLISLLFDRIKFNPLIHYTYILDPLDIYLIRRQRNVRILVVPFGHIVLGEKIIHCLIGVSQISYKGKSC